MRTKSTFWLIIIVFLIIRVTYIFANTRHCTMFSSNFKKYVRISVSQRPKNLRDLWVSMVSSRPISSVVLPLTLLLRSGSYNYIISNLKTSYIEYTAKEGFEYFVQHIPIPDEKEQSTYYYETFREWSNSITNMRKVASIVSRTLLYCISWPYFTVSVKIEHC